MPPCLQCGKCCLGLEWTFSYPGKGEDAKNPSDKIRAKAESKMSSYGLLYHRFRRAEKKDGKISLTYKVGGCQHLKFREGKAFCDNHANRPAACRDYFCDKAKKQ
ncbi:hypothetical protein GF323_04720 [Candidatus Woesearchaeota archaeon]|nr:hypothetical protein [Candidatus Woesearchaeota archaeon]